MITAFLDANVLVPITLTNVLLTAAEQGLFRVRWSPTVVAEAVQALREIRPGIPAEVIERRFKTMGEAFSDSVVAHEPAGFEHIVLPDPDDRHVVAGAQASEATLIVTANTRDFPDSALVPLGLVAVTPDQFLVSLAEHDSAAMASAIKSLSGALVTPEQSVEDILVALERVRIRRFPEFIRPYLPT
jgi:predicted nucleic acid-binding protein